MNLDFAKKYPRVWFIGIGGVSMSGLALMLQNSGAQVAGSDLRPSQATQMLEARQIPVHYGQTGEGLEAGWNLAVYTAAIAADNPEFLEAKRLGIPLMTRATLLGHIMAGYRNSIGVAGTHGKTTTTGMISHILLAADADPTITIGGFLPALSGNTRIGHSPVFLAEACEYTDSFLELSPRVAVILNVEAEHLDYFHDLAHVRASFRAYAARVPADGALVISSAVPDWQEIAANCPGRVETYGKETDDWAAADVQVDPLGHASFTVLRRGTPFAAVTLGVPGLHNVGNALAACAACTALGVKPEGIREGLRTFSGVDRRFQIKGHCNGALVVEDFAHHPTELAATLATAALVPHKRLWCAFQPHTYSRTRDFLDDFAKVLSQADYVLLADIYAAREKDDGTIHSRDLARRIKDIGGHGDYFSTIDAIVDYIKSNAAEGDLVLVLGAGDIYRLSQALISQ